MISESTKTLAMNALLTLAMMKGLSKTRSLDKAADILYQLLNQMSTKSSALFLLLLTTGVFKILKLLLSKNLLLILFLKWRERKKANQTVGADGKNQVDLLQLADQYKKRFRKLRYQKLGTKEYKDAKKRGGLYLMALNMPGKVILRTKLKSVKEDPIERLQP